MFKTETKEVSNSALHFTPSGLMNFANPSPRNKEWARIDLDAPSIRRAEARNSKPHPAKEILRAPWRLVAGRRPLSRLDLDDGDLNV